MKHKNQIINQVTGQVIRFIQTTDDTKGIMLEMESIYSSFSNEPPIHFHPYQDEFFEILSGELTVRLNNEITTYQQGQVIHIQPGEKHSMWNPGFGETIVNWKVLPALNTEYFLRTMTDLANKGITNNKGVPPLPAMVYLLKKYRKTFCLVKPPMVIILILFFILNPLFLLLGYKNKF